jgi:hypothetical protein
MVPQVGRAFGQCLNDALHATRPGPVILGEVEYAHGSILEWVVASRESRVSSPQCGPLSPA